MINWLFERPVRLWGTVAVVVGVGLVVAMAVLMIRVDNVTDKIQARPTGTPGITVPGEDATGGVTPNPEPTRRPLSSETEEVPTIDTEPSEVFVDAGDPEPRVAAAVDAWANWKFEDLAKYMLPAAEEDAMANPPGSKAGDLKVTGLVEVTEPGPSQAVVKVPTNKGTLLVDVVISDKQWFVASMGWA
jgi:hypothetical protein